MMTKAQLKARVEILEFALEGVASLCETLHLEKEKPSLEEFASQLYDWCTDHLKDSAAGNQLDKP